MNPTNVKCPKCGGVAPRHCTTKSCTLFRCARCRAYGSYTSLIADKWAEYHPILPLELLYEMASIEDDQRTPPRPAPSV